MIMIQDVEILFRVQEGSVMNAHQYYTLSDNLLIFSQNKLSLTINLSTYSITVIFVPGTREHVRCPVVCTEPGQCGHRQQRGRGVSRRQWTRKPAQNSRCEYDVTKEINNDVIVSVQFHQSFINHYLKYQA